MVDSDELQQLYRYGLALTNDGASAYDLLHDALEACIRKPPREEASRLAHIRRIMRNRHIDQLRRRSRFQEEHLDERADALGIDESLLDELMIQEEDLTRIWGTLDSVERSILFFWAVEDYSAREIAAELQIARGTVLSRLHRLRAKVQRSSSAHNNALAAEISGGPG